MPTRPSHSPSRSIDSFTTLADATLAEQALLDQVFLDGGSGSFDTDPELTNGCTSLTLCQVVTPYLPGGTIGIVYARNQDTSDSVIASGQGPSVDTSSITTRTFAIWSSVPEPGTGLLLGVGLFMMAAMPRRRA